MAYVPNSDDAVAPANSVLAGTAAAEFIALKSKINKLFLFTDYTEALLQQGLKAGTSMTLALPATNVNPGIMYGHAVNITRNDITGGGVKAVAAQLTAILGNNLDGFATNVSVFGVATEAWTSPVASHATLIGGEFSVISQYASNESALVGADIVFKNRPDNVAAPVQGLGANQYNKFSRAMQITSQQRSAGGENCGWWRGIIFGPGSLDYAKIGGVNVPGTAIDISAFSSAPATSEPWTAYKISSAVALSEYMSITWDFLKFTRSYVDSVNNRFVILGTGNSPTTVPRLSFDYSLNQLQFNSQTVGLVPGAATGSLRIQIGGVNYVIAVTPA